MKPDGISEITPVYGHPANWKFTIAKYKEQIVVSLKNSIEKFEFLDSSMVAGAELSNLLSLNLISIFNLQNRLLKAKFKA